MGGPLVGIIYDISIRVDHIDIPVKVDFQQSCAGGGLYFLGHDFIVQLIEGLHGELVGADLMHTMFGGELIGVIF